MAVRGFLHERESDYRRGEEMGGEEMGSDLQGVLLKYLSAKGVKEGVIKCPVARFYF